MNFKIGDKATWGLYGEKVTVIKMEDCVVTKVKIEYSDKSTAVVDMKNNYKIEEVRGESELFR